MQLHSACTTKQAAARVLVGVLLLVSLMACETKNDPELHGYLYFGAGYYLGRLSLNTGSAEPIARLGDVDIEHLDEFDENYLLLSISYKEQAGHHARIIAYNPRSAHTKELLPGTVARYFEAAKTVVYDNGKALVAVPRRRLRSEGVTVYSHRRNQFPDAVVLSDTELLFADRSVEPARIQRYDFQTNTIDELTALSVHCELQHAVWISDLQALMCVDPGSGGAERHYRLVALDGTVQDGLPLPKNKDLKAVVYLSDQDVVIFSETWRRWRNARDQYAVWALWLESGEFQRINKQQNLGESVVYRRLP